MAYTESDLLQIEQAIATGRLRVKIGEQEVQYHSVPQLLRARDVIKNELSSPTASKKKQYRLYTKKGL